MPVVALPHFAKGEISPTLYARVDTAMYKAALRTARNAIIHPYGGVSNRPGTVCIGPVKDHANSPRLFRFHLGTTDQYVLEFGNLYMRVIRNDAYVLNSSTAITGATSANPIVVTAGSHGFSDGADVVIVSVVGMVELNAGMYTVENTTTNTVELTSQVTGNNINGTDYTAYSSAGTIADVFELTTPYIQADLSTLKMVQSGNVLTITHPNYAPKDLTRSDHNVWALTGGATAGTGLTFAPTLAAPSTVSISTSTNTNFTVYETSNQTVRYQVTAIEDTEQYFEESLSTTATTTTSSDPPLNTITWSSVTDADRYAIYRQDNGIYGLIGETESTATLSFKDDNLVADLTLSPPRSRTPFTSNAPSASGYYQQRQVYGGSDNNPDTIYFSQTGLRLNMSTANPVQADDAITSSLSSQDVQVVRHFVPLDDLLVFTNAGEWRINSGGDSAFSADTIKYTPQTTWGSAHQVPIIMGRTVLFVEDGGANVRAMGFSLSDDGYNSPPLTLLADHLLAEKSPDEYVITDWAHQQFPEPRIYMVRSDGSMLTLTFNQEQEVIAWTIWDTDGQYESVTSLRRSLSGVEDGLYFVVKRVIDGQTQRTVERMHSRKYTDVRDTFFLDLGAELNNPISLTDITSEGVITSASHGLSDGDEIEVSDIQWKTDSDVFDGVFTVANKTDDTFDLLDRVWDSGRKVWVESAFVEAELPFSDLDKSPISILIPDDGSKMYVLEDVDSVIHQYTLSIPFDIATASYDSVTFDASGLTTDPTGMAFTDLDGTTLFLAGRATDDDGIITSTIYQITLSTGFDLSTASSASKSKDITANITGRMQDIDMDACGVKLYVATRDGDTSARVVQFELTTASDATTISYEKFLEVTSDSPSLYSVYIRNDGTQMFLLYDDIAGVAVSEYELSTAYEIETATLKAGTGPLSGISCARSLYMQETTGIDITQTSDVTNDFETNDNSSGTRIGLQWKPDGTKVFLVDDDGYFYAYDLSKAWDMRTAVNNSESLDISGSYNQIRGFNISSDGLIMILYNDSNNKIERFNLSSAWDISTAVASGNISSSFGLQKIAFWITINKDGTKLWAANNPASGSNGILIQQWSFSNAWDPSSLTFDGAAYNVIIPGDPIATPHQIQISDDGTKMYVLRAVGGDAFFELDFGVPYDSSTLVYNEVAISLLDLVPEDQKPVGGGGFWGIGYQFAKSGGEPCVNRLFPVFIDYLIGSSFHILSIEVEEEALDIRKMYIVQSCPTTVGVIDAEGSVYQINLDKITGDQGLDTDSNDYFRGGEVRVTKNLISGIAGLHCLNNTKVCIMADGVKEADQTVVNNTITIADGRKVARAAIGICYTTDVETLDIEVNSPPSTIQGKKKKITEVMTRFYKSAMPMVGPNSNDLVQMKGRKDDEYGKPQALVSGDRVTNIPASWNSNGRVFYRMEDPFPLTILGIFPDITIEEDID